MSGEQGGVKVVFSSSALDQCFSMNLTNFVDNLNRLPVHTTFTSIIGGNHQQFGSYDPSGRSRDIDGNATISRDAQLNATADALVRTLLHATKNNDISPRSLVDC